ncbi:MAG: glycosyltransferase [Eubacteriales bacterium]|nr:glycosyltransferase [Eubacteriales bacterium]
MRILHVTAGIGRSNGVMSVILNYARYMPGDIRFDVMYFVQTEDDRTKEIEALGGRVVKIAPPGLHSFCRDDVDAYLQAHKGAYSAIHIHLPYLASLLAPKARRAGVSKVYVHCHSTWFSLEHRNSLRNRIFNLPTERLADHMFACGRDAGVYWYGKRAMERGRVKVLPNAIVCDMYRFSQAKRQIMREQLGLTEELVVGHVGRVSPPQKNHPFLFRVFAEIYRKRPDAVLLLAGAEPNEELAALAERLGIQAAIRWLGLRSDVAQLLQAMDLFVFPSFYEGLPVAVVEAESAGLPVVMSDAVTDEVCVTKQILRLPLSLAPEEWAKRALALCENKRVDTADQVVKAGFDLKTSAAWLAEFYRK